MRLSLSGSVFKRLLFCFRGGREQLSFSVTWENPLKWMRGGFWRWRCRRREECLEPWLAGLDPIPLPPSDEHANSEPVTRAFSHPEWRGNERNPTRRLLDNFLSGTDGNVSNELASAIVAGYIWVMQIIKVHTYIFDRSLIDLIDQDGMNMKTRDAFCDEILTIFQCMYVFLDNSNENGLITWSTFCWYF